MKKILYIATECKPFSKVGGVGDVTGELPPALKEKGWDVEIVTPCYGSVDSSLYSDKPVMNYNVDFKNNRGVKETQEVEVYTAENRGVPVSLIKNSTYFEGKYAEPYIYSPHTPFYDDFLRFSFFSEACIQLIKEKKPDIVHINDWPLSFLFARMELLGMKEKRVLTIHNNGYQGNIWIPAVRQWTVMEFCFNKRMREAFEDPRKRWNCINPLKLAMVLADQVNTVSPGYMKEMMKKENPSRYFEGGKGLYKVIRSIYKKGKLSGIINGFEYKEEPTEEGFNQLLKEKAVMRAEIAGEFENPDNLLLGFVGRAVEQKFKLLKEEYDGESVFRHLADLDNVNIAVLATGLKEYEEFLKEFEDEPNVSVTLAFDRERAAKISLGCDLFLMPSLFEPCGITQMESLSHGTPPLVRWTGGLKDTVIPYNKKGGTGFGFNGFLGKNVLQNFTACVQDASEFRKKNPEGFKQVMKNGYFTRFRWSDTADSYIELYNKL